MTLALRPPTRISPSTLPCALALVGALVSGRAHAQTTTDAVSYSLEPPSSYNVGCYGPCDCAVRSAPMAGGFRLRFVSSDPLFRNYAVEEFHATARTDSQIVDLRGFGDYRIGGEFALSEQLKLSIKYPDGTVQAFDSGLVPDGASFPAIRIAVAAHGFACYDTVIEVAAKPATAGIPGPGEDRALLRASPNPFRGGTTIECTLPRAARVGLAIVDPQGREVASLARGLPLAAGPHTLTWDGRNAEGALVRAGVYLAILRTPGTVAKLRLVRLE